MRSWIALVVLMPSLLAGCLSSAQPPDPLLVDAYAQDTDDDGKQEMVVDLFFSEGQTQGVRAEATGVLILDRHPPNDETWKRYAERPFDVKSESLRWHDTAQGFIYRHIINDHHLDKGYIYRITLDLHGHEGQEYQAESTVPYEI